MLAKGKKKAGAKVAPALTSTEDIQTEQRDTNIENYIFNPNEKLPEENILITIQGKSVLTEKNVCVITGKPKSRKSVIAHSILAAGLSKSQILGIEVNTSKNIVLIDTEQSKHDLQKSLQRMCKLAKVDTIPAQLTVYSVRELNVLQVKNLLVQVCENDKTELVIIDGALDLINNINDIEETKEVIDMIKKILVKRAVSLVLVIHQSKSTNFTIGHFGSYFDRFSQSVIEVSKLETGNSKIQSLMMRSDADFIPYEFYYNHLYNTYSVSYTEDDTLTANKAEDIPNHRHLDILKKIFSREPEQTYTSLISELKQEYGKSDYFAKQTIKHLFNIGLLDKIDGKIKFIEQPF